MEEIKGLQERMKEFKDRIAKIEVRIEELEKREEKREEEEDAEEEFNNEGEGGQKIYEETEVTVRTMQGLTRNFKTMKGVRQRCDESTSVQFVYGGFRREVEIFPLLFLFLFLFLFLLLILFLS